jgi:hypothetical protein
LFDSVTIVFSLSGSEHTVIQSTVFRKYKRVWGLHRKSVVGVTNLALTTAVASEQFSSPLQQKIQWQVVVVWITTLTQREEVIKVYRNVIMRIFITHTIHQTFLERLN